MVLLACTSVQIHASEGKVGQKIYSFGPGVHVIDELHLAGKHAVLEGEGRGVTILKMKKGVYVSGPEPIIRNLTLIGAGESIGIHLENTWAAAIQNVEIENFGVGIKFVLSEKGRIAAGGKTLNYWPSALTKNEHWGSRISLSELHGVEIVGPGEGIVFENTLKKTTDKNYWLPTDDRRDGEFINATSIYGGHIAVKGKAMRIGDGVGTTKIYGTYFDISDAGGIFMDYGARNLLLLGVSLDLNSAARKADAPRLVVSKRALPTVQVIGCMPNKFPIVTTKQSKG